MCNFFQSLISISHYLSLFMIFIRTAKFLALPDGDTFMHVTTQLQRILQNFHPVSELMALNGICCLLVTISI